jgi:hypothetical protein
MVIWWVQLKELSQNSQAQCRQGGTTTFKVQVLNEASLHEDVQKIPPVLLDYFSHHKLLSERQN